MTTTSPNNSIAGAPLDQENARGELANWLRLARERSGLSIDAISQETRISKTYILSLEAGKLEALPGKVFGRGFVKNITRLLKTDMNEGLRLYDACWGTPVAIPVEEASTAQETNHVEPHKTKSVKARIAEPVNISSPVTQRLMTGDFTLAGEKPRLSNTPAAQRKISVKMPAWLVRGVVSPHIRLWVLAGIATVFVGLVFGRWAAGNLHKTRLAERSVKTTAVATKTASKSGAELSGTDLVTMDQEKAMAEVARATSALSDASSLNTASANSTTSGVVAKVAAADKSPSIASDEDNPLYMPSNSGAAFEQVVEFKVAENVEMRVTLDGKKVEKINYEPQSYRFTFNDRAEIYIMDASNVDLIYNGKSLGVLGNKGRKRRIFLQAKASESDFPQ